MLHARSGLVLLLSVCFLWSAALLTPVSSALAASSANTEISSLREQSFSWANTLEGIEAEVNASTAISPEQRSQWQDRMKQIRSDAQQLAERAQESLKSEKAVLEALGPEPEEGKTEAASIRRQREKLNAEIDKIDAELKRANLAVARADEIKTMIAEQAQAETRSKLFSRSTMIANPSTWPQIAKESAHFAANFMELSFLLYLVLGMLFIAGLSFPVTNHLNRFAEKAPHIRLVKKFSRKRLLVMAAAIYVVFLLRLGLVDLGAYTALEDTLQAAASICLALVLFGALGKFQFIANTAGKDLLGERKHSYHGLYNNIKQLVRFLLVLVPIASLIGYINLTLYLTFNVALTFAAILLFIWLRSVAVKIICRMSANDGGKEDEKELSPLAVSIIEPVLALVSLSLILFFWGMTTEDVAGWFTEFKGGIKLGDITIDFISIGSAITLFIALWLATKIFQWFLSSRVFQYTKLDSGIKDAILAITGYIGIIFALLVGMGALGLDMSNLAIVAGALSVGIGFGLQAIFNNFVSGLILLFERPVKVGDWVIVGENSGVIKKIRVRSTEIETFWNSSVIVPNSQLISETVTNWTLHDRAGRVDVAVGVAYGSDTKKVEQVLLDVAKSHPQVRAYPESKVIFTSFGDSSLDFELRCFIHNIRDVYTVTSELRFAVDAAFRENGIEIPFPQRDLHIKSSHATLNVNNGAAQKGSGDDK